MTDHSKLVKALRHCTARSNGCVTCAGCPMSSENGDVIECINALHKDAAAAIEELQAEVERLKDSNEELRERQTYIDHYGDKWLTSAKDVPTAAYEHGYADGMAEAKAQLPKRGEWIEENRRPRSSQFVCSECHRTAYDPQPTRDKAWRKRCRYAYCPNCGEKMEVQE